MNSNTKTLLTFSFILVLFIGTLAFIQDQLNQNRTSKSPYESLALQAINNAKAWSIKADYYKKLKQPIIDSTKKSIYYHNSYYNSNTQSLPDTCKIVISNYKKLRDITDSLLTLQITYQDSTILSQDSAIKWHLKRHELDSSELKRMHGAVSDTVKYWKKRSRKNGLKWFFIGNATGAAIGKGVDVITR